MSKYLFKDVLGLNRPERQIIFVFNKMSIIIEGKNISNNDDAEYVFEPTN